MAIWHWSDKLKTDGDGVVERHVKNLLYSRILEEEEEQEEKFHCTTK